MESTPAPISGDDVRWPHPPSRADHSNFLRIIRHDRRVTIGFNGREIDEDSMCLVTHRDELVDLIESGDFDCVIFDLTGVKIVLRGPFGVALLCG